MDGVDVVLLGDGDDAGNVEIGFDRPFTRANLIGFVRFEAMKRKAVFLGIDRDGAQAEFVGCPKDANGDFAAVGREKLADGLIFLHTQETVMSFEVIQNSTWFRGKCHAGGITLIYGRKEIDSEK
jgi:hypothetical protein